MRPRHRRCGRSVTAALGGLAGDGREANRGGERETLGGNRVVAAMAVAGAALSLLLDVSNFPAAGHFAVPANDAPTAEGGEAEKSNETHDALQK